MKRYVLILTGGFNSIQSWVIDTESKEFIEHKEEFDYEDDDECFNDFVEGGLHNMDFWQEIPNNSANRKTLKLLLDEMTEDDS